MGIDEINLQVMDVEMIIANFPIRTCGTYILTSSSYSIDIVLKNNLNASRSSEYPPVRGVVSAITGSNKG